MALRGDPEHPTTKGLVCAKALFLPKIVDPVGQARPDYDIFLDLAARLEKAGVVPAGYISGKLKTPEDIWNEMREASRGTPDGPMSTITRMRGPATIA